MTETPKERIKGFFENIRSGKQLNRTHEYMHDQVIAHQVQSENEYIVTRSCENYMEHIKEMKELYGNFQLEIQEILQDQQKVYVRWKQTGQLINGKKIIEIASAVYLIEGEKIKEYWIQIDRKGMEIQEAQNE